MKAFKPNSYALAVLAALQFRKMYEGTVPAHVKQARRVKGRMAKQSRKKNRG